MGMSFPLNLKAGAITRKRPQNPIGPFPYTTEEVSFTNEAANVTLFGTLTYPVSYKKGDKIPVALMVTGSGPENRDNEIYDHKSFLIIADYLARNGIATLRYDDRAVGKSTGEYETANTKEVVDDAKAGVEFLRKLKQFSKVGIIGHSEGGTVTFMLGAQKAIDFAISLAGMSAKGLDVFYEQAKIITELSGQPFAATKEQYKETLAGLHNTWFDYMLDYDPTLDIRKMQCPVFALNGDKDVQVVAAVNIPAIKNNLPKNAKSKVKVYPGLNHLFQECTTGLPNEYANIEQTISPVVLKDIVDWIKRL